MESIFPKAWHYRSQIKFLGLVSVVVGTIIATTDKLSGWWSVPCFISAVCLLILAAIFPNRVALGFFSAFEANLRRGLDEDREHLKFELAYKGIRLVRDEQMESVVRRAHNLTRAEEGIDWVRIEAVWWVLDHTPNHNVLFPAEFVESEVIRLERLAEISDTLRCITTVIERETGILKRRRDVVEAWCRDHGKDPSNLSVEDVLKIRALPEWQRADRFPLDDPTIS